MNKILLLLAFCVFVFACKTDVKEEKKPTVSTEQFQQIVESIYKANPEMVGLVMHIESPKNGISWTGSAGYSDEENKTPLQADQPVLIASSIKTYIAATMLRLQEEGKLTMEDPIGKHLTEKTAKLLAADGYQLDKIKIKHLLSHTSGIDDYVNDDYFKSINDNPKYRWTRDEQLKLSMKIGDPLGEPQSRFRYADANFLLCTEIMEQLTGKPFHEAIPELLKYKELGLNHTWFPTLEEKPANTKELAHQYWREKDYGAHKLDIDWDSRDHDISWDLYGGGGIATNMEELALFSYHLFNENVIEDKEILQLLTTDVPTTDGNPKIYRLGIAAPKLKGIQTYVHGGFWGTMAFYVPQLDAAISMCVLERNGKMKVIEHTMNEILAELTNQVYPNQVVSNKNYELHKAEDAKATLVLFPGGGANAKTTKEEFDILTTAAANQVSVLLMNSNKGLFLEEPTTKAMAEELETIFNENKLNTENVVIGGMSIGGNAALSLSDYLLESKAEISPKGVFIVDSPLDLYALYLSSVKDTKNPNLDEERLIEPRYIIQNFEEKFGKESLIENIQKISPFTYADKATSVGNLKQAKLRFYTEPDADWWKENRQTDFESTNAYAIRQVAKDLESKGWNQFELIETSGKGFRANGDRHPHSWSIVDTYDLLNWINE